MFDKQWSERGEHHLELILFHVQYNVAALTAGGDTVMVFINKNVFLKLLCLELLYSNSLSETFFRPAVNMHAEWLVMVNHFITNSIKTFMYYWAAADHERTASSLNGNSNFRYEKCQCATSSIVTPCATNALRMASNVEPCKNAIVSWWCDEWRNFQDVQL